MPLRSKDFPIFASRLHRYYLPDGSQFAVLMAVKFHWPDRSSGRIGGRQAVAGALLGLYLVVLAGVILPAFHHFIHADEADSGHRCAVTLISAGQIDISEPTVQALSTPAIFVGSSPADRLAIPDVDYCFSSERAPPVFLA
jgi:hypothetical protein